MRRTRHALGAAAREVAIEKGGPVPEKPEAGLPLPLDKSIYISVCAERDVAPVFEIDVGDAAYLVRVLEGIA